jgi:hypothetical protein
MGKLLIVLETWCGCLNRATDHVCDPVLVDVYAPWSVQTSHHRDLGIGTVADIIATFANSHEKRLRDHINIEASRLLNVNNMT